MECTNLTAWQRELRDLWIARTARVFRLQLDKRLSVVWRNGIVIRSNSNSRLDISVINLTRDLIWKIPEMDFKRAHDWGSPSLLVVF